MNLLNVDKTSINSFSCTVVNDATDDQNNCGNAINCSLYNSLVIAF